MTTPIAAGETLPEVTVVIPCLNEEKTIAGCVSKALAAFRTSGIRGEVLVADNGSRDRSRELGREAGAHVITVSARGYGSALMAGIEAARSPYIVMGDADGSYDFGEVPQFVAKLRQGYELVQGCRLPVGGGTVAPEAMPWLHRWVGNPALTMLARVMFGTRLHDVYCGLRAFTKSFYARMDLRCTGMEFATEMIIKAATHGARTAEHPITLHKDGREGAGSHLRTFRDGWRTLRLFLLYSPRWAHLVPSSILLVAGLITGLLAFLQVKIGPATLGAHSLLVAAVAIMLGYQGLLLALFTSTLVWRERQMRTSHFLERFYSIFTLERGLVLSGLAAIVGVSLVAAVFLQWREGGYGELPYGSTLRFVAPGVLLIALATQTFFGSFIISLTSLERK